LFWQVCLDYQIAMGGYSMNAFTDRSVSALLTVVAMLIASPVSAQGPDCEQFVGQSVSLAGEVFNVTKDDQSGHVVYFVSASTDSNPLPCSAGTLIVTGASSTARCKLGQKLSGTGTITGDSPIPSTVLIQATKYSCKGPALQ